MGQPDLNNLPHYTWNDYQNWEGAWELIDGIPYAMSPAPSIEHQRISSNLAWQFNQQLQNCPSCQHLLPVDWKIDKDTIVQPDHLIVCGEVSGNYLDRAPILVVEILSPSTEQKDRNAKFKIYENNDVGFYLIVSPEAQEIEVYERGNSGFEKRDIPSRKNIKLSIQDDCEVKLNIDVFSTHL